MTTKDKFIKFFNKVFDVFAPEHECMACGKEIPDGTEFSLCEKCKSEIVWLNGRTCMKCGDLLLNETMVCDHCKDSDYVFDRNISCCYYGEKSAAIVKGFKYNSRKYYAKHIAEIMALQKSAFEDVDIITFVPISKNRKRIRGFNQSEEIAKHLSETFNIKMKSLLIKFAEGKHQAKLSREERLKNLSGSFDLEPNIANEIKYKRILIVDDVFTTGTTLNECTKVLKKAKPKSVTTITFAKTEFSDVSL